MYRKTENPDIILDTSTGAFFSVTANTWISQAYAEWLEAGNEPAPERPPLALAQLRDQLREAATARRWEVEQAGIVVAGVPVQTTTEDQNRITSVLTAITLGNLAQVDFKSAAGWITLPADAIKGLGAAISAHIQACFTAERRHHEAIEALQTVEALEAYDVSQGWPSTIY